MAELLKARLDRHFVACSAAAAAAVGGGVQTSDAAIVYRSTPVAIPGTFAGVYLNVFTGVAGANTTTGWDLNPYYGGTALYQATGAQWVLNGASAANLAPGTVIGPTSTFGAGGGTAAGTPNFTPGVDGLIGFRFVEGTTTYYGWARLNKAASPSGQGQFTNFAFEDTGGSIAAGAVPAPGSIALMALGAVGLVGRRRRA